MTSHDLDDGGLERAHELLAEYRSLQDFAYSGDLPLGETWAFTLARHRDSDTLAESNWHVIQRDMHERFPDDVEIVRCSHWAVGHVDHLAVRLMTEEGDLTDAGHAILEWKERLDDYPVADDEDFSEREIEVGALPLLEAARPQAAHYQSADTQVGLLDYPAGSTAASAGLLAASHPEYDYSPRVCRAGPARFSRLRAITSLPGTEP